MKAGKVGRAHVEGDDQNPTIYVFQASQLPDNLNILPSSKVPSSTVTRPRGIELASAVQHIVTRIRGHLSVSHQLNTFCSIITSFIAVTDITFMAWYLFIIFKLSRLGSCRNNYLAFLSNFAACMRPRLHQSYCY